jgi:PAS domain S-box-containing protein
MNIAVVGGGIRCRELIKIIKTHTFKKMSPQIIGVADINVAAPGFVLARESGLFVTQNYNDFFDRDDIDLIIELTGNMDVYNDIIKKKKRRVRAIASGTAMLFWEISRISYMQKETREELKETKKLYKTAVNELIQEDVIVISSDYRVVDANDTSLQKLGLSRDEAIGRFCYEITHHKDQPCSGENHACPLLQAIKTKGPFQTTHIHFDKSGNKIYYSISIYPIFDKDTGTGAIEISRDITKDINLQKAMMQQEKLASVGRLSAGVAHEINNPLTTILTTAMLIQEDLSPEDPIYQELSTVTDETLRCRKIVTSLLNFARQSSPTKKENSINAIIAETVLLTQKQAAFKDLAIEVHYFEDIPPVNVDKGQIHQALINLIINAIEATEPGGKISVTTHFSSMNDKVEIRVADNGKGMTEETIDRIFDPFFTDKKSGTGLGLAITHGIIEQHDGAIDVKSSPREGSTFTIRLPIAKGDTHADDSPHSNH